MLVKGTSEHLVDTLTRDAERPGKLGLVGARLMGNEQALRKLRRAQSRR